MQRFVKALLVGLSLFLMVSCSWFLSSYEGPIFVSHGYVKGITPANAEAYKQRTYQTVQANWPGPGGDKLWLAVNLGATGEPQTSVDDNANTAGWYFQFNRKQGYYHDGTNVTPQWTVTTIDENSRWKPANDPCRLLLGGTWRIPNVAELRAFLNAPAGRGGMGEGNRTSAFNSTLKLHAAGNLKSFDGEIDLRSESGNYWASDQFSENRAEILTFGIGSNTFAGNKAFGRSVRCIRD